MQSRALGRTGVMVSAMGLGCAGMSPEKLERDDDESIATVRRARDLGVSFIDTSDAYGNGHNESLIGRAIKGRRKDVFLTTKFGNIRGAQGQRGGTNGRPDYVPVACENSLKRLGIEVIDLGRGQSEILCAVLRIRPGCRVPVKQAHLLGVETRFGPQLTVALDGHLLRCHRRNHCHQHPGQGHNVPHLLKQPFHGIQAL